MKKVHVLAVAMLCLLATAVNAQKFGYCNSKDLLTQIPEIKAADSDLQAFQTQLTKKGQERVKALQDNAAELDRKKNQGIISPKEYEEQMAKLEAEQESIAAYQEEVYDKLAKKREELYKPLLDKINKAMEDVAKENGFDLVFDSSTNILIYAHETLNVTPMVKAKLGISN
ncbi:MAG: OmpH family outer membrane protein [Lewinellaceae bacterium]|nr:OmpH family outer membrane protein [Lewinellaceae bacterium]